MSINSRIRYLARIYEEGGLDRSSAWHKACQTEKAERKSREDKIRQQVASDDFDMMNCTM